MENITAGYYFISLLLLLLKTIFQTTFLSYGDCKASLPVNQFLNQFWGTRMGMGVSSCDTPQSDANFHMSVFYEKKKNPAMCWHQSYMLATLSAFRKWERRPKDAT